MKTFEFFFIYDSDDHTARVEAEDRADADTVLFQTLCKDWDVDFNGEDAEWFQAECSYYVGEEVDLAAERIAKAGPELLVALENLWYTIKNGPGDLSINTYGIMLDAAMRESESAIKAARGEV